jgi:hypothetical protein
MNSELEAAERAEFIQSVKSLLIPLCLFLACVIMAAGTFLIYNHEPLGWAFALVSTLIIISCMVAFIRFQNSYRARGILKHGTDAEVINEPTANTAEHVTEIASTTSSPSEEEPPVVVAEAANASNVVEFKPTKQRQNQ